MSNISLSDHFVQLASLLSNSGLEMLLKELERAEVEHPDEVAQYDDFRLWEEAISQELATRERHAHRED